MNRRLISPAALITLAAIALQAQKHPAQSAASALGWPPAPTVKFVASTEKTFDQLMSKAMSVMDRDMHNAQYTGETTMISLP